MKTPRLSGLAVPIGEAGYGPEAGPVGMLDTLVRAGLPVPAGIVLTEDAHRLFLDSGVSGRIAEPLSEAIRESLIGLGARTVVVISSHHRRSGLGSIPEVFEAVSGLWRPVDEPGAAPGSWPLAIQREPEPERIIVSSSACSGGLRCPRSVRPDLSSAGRISTMTLRAGAALEGPVALGWGLEDGHWLLISAQPEI